MSGYDYQEVLAKLGLELGEEQESRSLTVLRSILSISEDIGQPHSFGEIYNQIQEKEDGFDPSKAWVHRLLKSLLDNGLIRLETPDAHRNRYIADVNSIANGLEKLKEAKEEALRTQLKQINDELSFFVELDVGVIAEQLIEELTGQKQALSSRFIRGRSELHRVMKNNINARARKGDIIRSNLSWLGSLAIEGPDRIQKDIEAARRGVEVRWMIDNQVFRQDEEIQSHIPRKAIFQVFQKFIALRKDGAPFHIRLRGGPETHNYKALNRQALAMIITEEPMTATYVTRDFNADLIDNTVDNFDDLWQSAIPIFELKKSDLDKMGINGVVGKAIAKLIRSEE